MPTEAEIIEAVERAALRQAVEDVTSSATGLPQLKDSLRVIVARLVKNGQLPKSTESWE